MREEQGRICKLVRDVLGPEYLELRVDRVHLEEDLVENMSSLRAELHDELSGEKQVIEGRGVGVVDAFFQALVGRLSAPYPSLKTIEFSKFQVDGRIDTKRQIQGADAVGEVTLMVRNSERREFEFRDASRSITASALRAVLEAVEYFVNSERAFVAVWKRLEDARARNRDDLVQSYTAQLVELVKNTSYSEVIEGIRQKLR
ncbi:MAG TPA: alpha-isopropylmalate synthase regulatory domain-containing protein [Polyangia bacterium]|nr:alpha-isopropylmalate synthase regulatory domain-containing protein [Polyangia bacterium]